MKTSIDSSRGIVVERDGSGFFVEGKPYTTASIASFDNRWGDLPASVAVDTKGSVGLISEAYRDTGFFVKFFRSNQNDSVFMSFQMPHSWNPSTSVYPHIHVIPMSSGSGVVKMNYAYSWCLVNEALPAGRNWISGSVTASYTPSDQYVHRVISFGSISPPANAVESAMLVFKIERPGMSDNEDTYQMSKGGGTTAAANLAVLFFDLHYQRIKAGSTSQYPEIL